MGASATKSTDGIEEQQKSSQPSTPTEPQSTEPQSTEPQSTEPLLVRLKKTIGMSGGKSKKKRPRKRKGTTGRKR